MLERGGGRPSLSSVCQTLMRSFPRRWRFPRCFLHKAKKADASRTPEKCRGRAAASPHWAKEPRTEAQVLSCQFQHPGGDGEEVGNSQKHLSKCALSKGL